MSNGAKRRETSHHKSFIIKALLLSENLYIAKIFVAKFFA